MMSPELTFWQNIPSIHQAPMIREVTKHWPGLVRVVTESDVPVSRRKQGWCNPDFGDAQLLVEPDPLVRSALTRELDKDDCVHLFSGINAYPATYRTLRCLAQSQAILGVMVEPGSHIDGWRVPVRRFSHKALAWRWRRRVDIVLATGELGRKWWCDAGFCPSKVVTFGYFVDAIRGQQSPLAAMEHQEMRTFRIIYVGSLTHTKGIDLALQALAEMDPSDWSLDIIGSGPLEEECKQFVSNHGLSANVHWHGNMANSEVISRMAISDLLLLPSRFDGWGAVTNESLCVGTPALVSDACGSRDLIVSNLQGEVFPSLSVEKLKESLCRRIAAGPVEYDKRERIRSWAVNAIGPGAAAQYLIELISSTRSPLLVDVSPPWLSG
jgi:glycosyltransferase involved in cell wall biosynthesis